MEKIRNIERKAMRVQKPQAGLTELMAYVDSRGLRKGICTRNFECVLLPSLLSSTLPPVLSTYPAIPS